MPPVLLLCGPTSSGKTALMQYLLRMTPKRFDSIPRKRIAYELRGRIEAEIFGSLFKELKEFTQNKITTLEQLFLTQYNSLFSRETEERLVAIKQLVQQTEQTDAYQLLIL